MGLMEFFRKYFPRVYYEYETFFNNVSNLDYVDLEDYHDELNRVKLEIKDVERTINYFKDRHKVLTEWQLVLEERLGSWNSEDTCFNCKHYHQPYCQKHKMNTVSDATCDDFVWKNTTNNKIIKE